MGIRAENSFHGFAAGALAVGNQDARPPAWVGALNAGCDTVELAGVTWACRWRIDRMCVELGLSGWPVVLHVDSQYAISSVNGHGDLLSTKRQSTTRELPSAFWRLSLRSLWSGVLGTVGIRGTNSRMRLPSRPLMTLR